MKKILRPITDWVSTKKGMTWTIVIWLVLMIGLSFGPQLGDYKVTNFESLPSDAQSIIAKNTIAEYFPNDQGTPGIYVFHNPDGEIVLEEVNKILTSIINANLEGMDFILDISKLPPQALGGLMSEDKSTIIVPVTLEAGLGSGDFADVNDEATLIGQEAAKGTSTEFYITGGAGIAGDTVKLFERADFVLLIATVAIILVLLIAIYRSPLLAFIPLLATVIVYQVANQSIALMGYFGLEINNQTTSIMSILLFAAVIDYSLFVFSRFKEELNHYESKYEAMKYAMRSTGEPVFFAGGTVFAAMLILFFADFRDYVNFAPIFGLAVFIIMLASVTLVPALFTLFGRKSFWPKVPVYGQEKEVKHAIWSKVAKFVVNRPGLSGGLVALLMIISSLNVFNLEYEFDMVKSFPEDMNSRIGYEIVEEKYAKGDLAPMTLMVVSEEEITAEMQADIATELTANEEIASARVNNISEDKKAVTFSISLTMNPYSEEALIFVEQFREELPALIDGKVYLAGETSELVDERNVNNSDIIKIVILETILILVLLFTLTRSFKMPLYMMATILLSYVSALGLGIFLVDVFFGFDAISTRVPVYAFVFLVALGIDYNIILVSRFQEEHQKHPVKKALEIAITNTGGVISSAGIILAATFLALTTMPIADLFVFGFMVAVGIIIDTFLVRGMLLPALILFFEKDKK